MNRTCAAFSMLLAAAVLAAVGAGQAPRDYVAYAYVDGKVLGGTNGRVRISFAAFSSQEARARALQTLVGQGQQALDKELRQLEPVGNVQVGERTNYLIVLAHEFKHGEQRRIVAITAGSIGDFESRSDTRAADESIGFIELRFEADGTGRGVIVADPDLVVNPADVTLAIEDYARARVHLVNVIQP